MDALAGGVYVKTCGLALILFSDSVIDRDARYRMTDVPCPALNPPPHLHPHKHVSQRRQLSFYRAETSVASLAPTLALALQISKSPVGRSLVFDNWLLKRDNDSDNRIR